jgi:hypothetical protein
MLPPLKSKPSRKQRFNPNSKSTTELVLFNPEIQSETAKIKEQKLKFKHIT